MHLKEIIAFKLFPKNVTLGGFGPFLETGLGAHSEHIEKSETSAHSYSL